MFLFNTSDKKILKQRLKEEPFRRRTLSFYRYVRIDDVQAYRDHLYREWSAMNVLGRIFIAHEGINAQLSVPENNYAAFVDFLNADQELKNVELKFAVEDDGKSFYKLIVRIKKKIVADGLKDDSGFDTSNVGTHLDAKKFNEAMQMPGTIVIDMRNHYESEVGRFENALCPEADTFREAINKAVELAEDKKENKILLYCTGGIRCEKASAWFRHKGFKDVNQLYGGIIAYARQVKAENLENKFRGKNFVFDERMGERISDEIISACHQCGNPSDRHVNCANDACHLLFIQCEQCAGKYKGCCTPKCMEVISLPVEEQKKLRKGKPKSNAHAVHKSRLRPNLRELLSQR